MVKQEVTDNKRFTTFMSNRKTTKYKIERRFGVSLWGRAKSPVKKRPYASGQHGGVRNRKSTDYGLQLFAKQKLKGHYGNLGEKQFRSLYFKALKKIGDTSENLLHLLEKRLDTVVYRMKFAVTPFQARQLINHGHIYVNDKRVSIPSYQVRENDTIEVKPTSKKILPVVTAQQLTERDIPDYLEVHEAKVKGKFLRAPTLEDIPFPCIIEPHLVIEFYSK